MPPAMFEYLRVCVCVCVSAGRGVLHPGAVGGWRSEPEGSLFSSQLSAGQWPLHWHELRFFRNFLHVCLKGRWPE